MKYIEKVILENFQSHKYSIIEFDNSLNVIVGASDSGKTAILRGIKWVLYNEPSGDYYIREGETECSVTLFFSDNTKVKRYRSRTKNAYYLYNSKDEETVFEGFGTTVPLEIQDSTGIKKILFDRDTTSNINIADQLEGAFLLSERPSIRANSIGRLVGVNIIDDALRDTLKDNRNYSIDKNNIESNIKELEEELLEYSYLEDIKIKVEKIEAIKEKIEYKSNINEKLKNLNKKTNALKDEKIEYDKIIKELRFTENLSYLIDKISLNLTSYNHYMKSLLSFNQVRKENKELVKIISSLKDIEQSDGIIRSIQSNNYLINSLINSKLKLDKINLEIKELNYTIEKLKDIDILKDKLDLLNTTIYNLSNLININNKLSSILNSKSIGEKYLEKLSTLENVVDLFNLLNMNINKINKMLNFNSIYSNTNSELKKFKTELDLNNKNIETLTNKYKEILLKQEKCPLCFSTIDANKINTIIDHYTEKGEF